MEERADEAGACTDKLRILGQLEIFDDSKTDIFRRQDLDLRRHRRSVDGHIPHGLLLLLKRRYFPRVDDHPGDGRVARRRGQQIDNPKRHGAGDDDKKHRKLAADDVGEGFDGLGETRRVKLLGLIVRAVANP